MGDYGPRRVDEAEARLQIDRADEFLRAALAVLGP